MGAAFGADNGGWPDSLLELEAVAVVGVDSIGIGGVAVTELCAASSPVSRLDEKALSFFTPAKRSSFGYEVLEEIPV